MCLDDLCAYDRSSITASVPHYHVMSKVGLREGGLVRVPLNWIRRFLIESIYRRLSESAMRLRERFAQ